MKGNRWFNFAFYDCFQLMNNKWLLEAFTYWILTANTWYTCNDAANIKLYVRRFTKTQTASSIRCTVIHWTIHCSILWLRLLIQQFYLSIFHRTMIKQSKQEQKLSICCDVNIFHKWLGSTWLIYRNFSFNKMLIVSGITTNEVFNTHTVIHRLLIMEISTYVVGHVGELY